MYGMFDPGVQAIYAQKEREKAQAEQAKLNAQIQASAAPQFQKGYTPTEQDLAKNPFGNNYAVDPSTGRYLGAPVDASGRPVKQEFVSIADPKTGLVRSQYQIKNQLDPSTFDAYKAEAMRAPGSQSKWAQLAQSQGLNDLASSQAGQMSQARNQLAMQGGLRGGSRERLASQGMQQGLLAGQKLRSGISMQDEQNRIGQLEKAQGFQLQQAGHDEGIQKTNLQTTLSELLQKRGYDSGNYGEAMKAWGAVKTAESTPTSGGGKK